MDAQGFKALLGPLLLLLIVHACHNLQQMMGALLPKGEVQSLNLLPKEEDVQSLNLRVEDLRFDRHPNWNQCLANVEKYRGQWITVRWTRPSVLLCTDASFVLKANDAEVSHTCIVKLDLQYKQDLRKGIHNSIKGNETQYQPVTFRADILIPIVQQILYKIKHPTPKHGPLEDNEMPFHKGEDPTCAKEAFFHLQSGEAVTLPGNLSMRLLIDRTEFPFSQVEKGYIENYKRKERQRIDADSKQSKDKPGSLSNAGSMKKEKERGGTLQCSVRRYQSYNEVVDTFHQLLQQQTMLELCMQERMNRGLVWRSLGCYKTEPIGPLQ